jgi:hypothetical protein
VFCTSETAYGRPKLGLFLNNFVGKMCCQNLSSRRTRDYIKNSDAPDIDFVGYAANPAGF